MRPTSWLSLALDVNWQRWSTFRTLTIDFEKEPPLLLTPGATLYDVRMQNHWRDTLTARLGANATPLSGRPLQVRAGAFYDQSPIGDRSYDLVTPDSDKLGVAGGGSYALALGRGQLRFDLGVATVFMRDRNIAPEELVDPATGKPIPGSDRTILNKPAPSFFYGVTRVGATVVNLTVTAVF